MSIFLQAQNAVPCLNPDRIVFDIPEVEGLIFNTKFIYLKL